MLATLFAAAAVPVTIGLVRAASPVGSRDATAIERAYGRASGDPYWTYRAEQPVPTPIEQAYKGTKDWLSQPGAGAPQQPERYGRGGGYVGLEKFDALDWTTRDRMSAVGHSQSSAEGRTGG